MEKIEVNGEHRNDIYKALTPIADAAGHGGDIRWNFEKFVISADGKQRHPVLPQDQARRSRGDRGDRSSAAQVARGQEATICTSAITP